MVGLTDPDTVDWPIFLFLPRFRAVFRLLHAHSALSPENFEIHLQSGHAGFSNHRVLTLRIYVKSLPGKNSWVSRGRKNQKHLQKHVEQNHSIGTAGPTVFASVLGTLILIIYDS